MIKGTFETAEERNAAHNRYIADDMQNTAATARNLMGISTTERIRNLEAIIQEYEDWCGPLPEEEEGDEAHSGFFQGQAQSGFNPGFQAQSGFHQGFGPGGLEPKTKKKKKSKPKKKSNKKKGKTKFSRKLK